MVSKRIEGDSKGELTQLLQQIVKQEFKEILQTDCACSKQEFLTRAEVAEVLRVDLSTLHVWKKKGILTPYGIGGRVLYKREDIDKALTALL